MRRLLVDEPEYLRDQARLRPADSCGAPGLRQVGAWEAGRDDVSTAEVGEGAHVGEDPDLREPCREDGLGGSPDLAHQPRPVALVVPEAQLKATDAAEQPRHRHRTPHPATSTVEVTWL